MTFKRWTAQDIADALTVRRLLFDLIAAVPGEWNEDMATTTYTVRDLFIIPSYDADDEFPQRLGVLDCEALTPVFVLQWTGDDTAHFIRYFDRGEWEKRLVPAD